MRNIIGTFKKPEEDDGLTHYIENMNGWYYPCCGGTALVQLYVCSIRKDEVPTCIQCIVDVCGEDGFWEDRDPIESAVNR